MRLPYLILAVAALVNIGVDGYIYMALRSYCRRRIWGRIHLVLSALLLCMLVVMFCLPVRSTSPGALLAVMWMLYGYLTVYVPKYVFLICDVLSRVPCLFKARRRRRLSWTGLGLGVVIFLAMWWGALINRFNIRVNSVRIASPEVPAAFDGFRIAQISDLHVGTYGSDTTFLHKLVSEVNAQRPDMIVFTGDIVNRQSDELKPFVRVLSGLKAPYGVYSILGNHDYGDYRNWPDDAAKSANLQLLKDLQRCMGWHLLNNEHRAVSVSGDTLMLIGVENVGDPPFHTYGSLADAYPDAADGHFKVLLSHNPAHWDADIAGHRDKNIALTLSGHTHAMQMEVMGISPGALRYSHWGGLYADSLGRRLYVNVGAGTVGFPARIGATPEVTVFTLHRTP